MAESTKLRNRKRKASEAIQSEETARPSKRLKIVKQAPVPLPSNKVQQSFSNSSIDEFSDNLRDTNSSSSVKSDGPIASNWSGYDPNGAGFGSFESFDSFTVDSLTATDNKQKDEFVGFDKKPIAKLKGKIDSGDGADNKIFSLQCMVYELDLKSNAYKEKGVGTLHLNTYSLGEHDDKIYARLLARKDVTFKTLINARIRKHTKFDKPNAKTVRFTVFEQVVKSNETEDKEEDDDDDDVMNVTKSYLLKSKESDHTKIDTLLAKIKQIQQNM